MENDVALTVDPLEESINTLQSFAKYSALRSVDIGRSFPVAGEEEFLWHYLYGIAKPFINLLVFVDVGVGFNVEPVFDDEDEGSEVRTLCEDFINSIDFLTTNMQYATYREVLGRGCIVTTKTGDGSDFYYNEDAGVTGIDCINPQSLEPEQLRRAVYDRLGKENYLQIYTDVDGSEKSIILERRRVIYTTKNPFMKRSIYGVSSLAPAIGDLRTASKYPYHMERLSGKTSSLNRHFQINTDKLRNMKQGKRILESRSKSKEYMTRMYNLINRQQRSGGDVVTLDYIDSKEHSYAGKIPDITSMVKNTFEMIGIKMEVPIHLLSFSKDVNRATLETLTDTFVRRRINGSQAHYKRIVQKILNDYIAMKGFTDGYVKVNFNPFLPQDIFSMYERVANFVQKVPDSMSITEIRRKIDMPDEIEYGPADRQVEGAVMELFNPGSVKNGSDDLFIDKTEQVHLKDLKRKVLELYDENYS